MGSPSDAPRADRLFTGRGLLLLTLLSTLFTALVIQQSIAAGRLSLPPTFDDVTYMIDAARRLRTFQSEGVPSLFRDYIAHPPHAPLSTAMAFAAFALAGLQEWAPYAINGLVLLLILAFALERARPLPAVQRWACVVAAACVPFSIMSVFQFRPDLLSAVLTAIGIILLLERHGTRPSLLAGACFGLAMLSKPASSPATAAAFAAAGALRWFLDARGQGWSHPIRALQAPALAAAALAALAGPHLVLDGAHTWDYIRFNMVGPGRAFWSQDRTASQHLLYYLTGEGGAFLLGRTLVWPLLALAFAPAALALLGRDRRAGPQVCIALLLLVLLAISVAAPVKQRYFGAPFHALLIINAVGGLAALSVAALRQPRPAWRALGLLAAPAAAAALLLTFRWPEVWAAPTSPHSIAIRQTTRSLNDALRALDDARPHRLMLTFTGPVNGPTLEWLALRDGRRLETKSAEAAKALKWDPLESTCRHASLSIL